MFAMPTRIRGVDYPSMRAAAKALGVTHGAVWQAIERGAVDRVGLSLGRTSRTVAKDKLDMGLTGVAA